MPEARYHPLDFQSLTPETMAVRSAEFLGLMQRRRTVRTFSTRPVPKILIENAVATAGTAPSGANQQPWTFVCIQDQALKSRIRVAAEAEEKAFYGGRASEDWIDALAHLGTDWQKPFLETAPWLIAIFGQRWGQDANGQKVKHYYVPESVGIASGFIIAALHTAGLATLTHTPSPMGFLNKVCGRPESEKAMILLVVGYPADGTEVPVITKKPLDEIAVFL